MSGHAHPNYVKTWAILVVLLVISVVGPMAEIKVLTLVTAFGVAAVKAWLVARNFMHLNVEKRWVVYLLTSCVAFMVLFYAGTAPDVLNHEGQRWENHAAKRAVTQGSAAAAAPAH